MQWQAVLVHREFSLFVASFKRHKLSIVTIQFKSGNRPIKIICTTSITNLSKLLVRRYFRGTTISLLRAFSLATENCWCHGSTQRVAIVLMETKFCEVWERFESETFGVTQNYTDDFYFGFHRIAQELRHGTWSSVSPQFCLSFVGATVAHQINTIRRCFSWVRRFFFRLANSMMLFRSTQTEKKKRRGCECAEIVLAKDWYELCCGNKSL